jgi:hypothetical protein
MPKEELTDVQVTLLAARALIADRENWTKGAYARKENGDSCWELSSAARSWCLFGALKFCAPNEGVCRDSTCALNSETSNGAIEANDEGGHDAALALIDRTLCQIAESQQKAK